MVGIVSGWCFISNDWWMLMVSGWLLSVAGWWLMAWVVPHSLGWWVASKQLVSSVANQLLYVSKMIIFKIVSRSCRTASGKWFYILGSPCDWNIMMTDCDWDVPKMTVSHNWRFRPLLHCLSCLQAIHYITNSCLVAWMEVLVPDRDLREHPLEINLLSLTVINT